MKPKRSSSDVNAETWRADTPIIRVHNVMFGATEFNPGAGGGRFHPIQNPHGALIPTLYGSNTFDGALSETLFHDVAAGGDARAVKQSKVIPLLVSKLSPLRDLTLIRITSEGDAARYAQTRTQAEALHAETSADGLIWSSRQHQTSDAIVLFGDRVERSSFDIVESPQSLFPPSPAWYEVLRAAEAAGITIVMP
jgi:hypothetical protein